MYQRQELKQYDAVLLKDGRRGAVVEIWGKEGLSIDIGSSPADWDNIEVTWDEVKEIIHE